MGNPLIQAIELIAKLGDSNLLVLDASKKFNAEAVIPDSIRFDLPKDFSDSTSPFPNTMPSTAQFERKSKELGIKSDSEIVVYDNAEIFNSPRVWYMFKAMGHENIRVLDGGMPAYIAAGGTTNWYKHQLLNPGNFIAQFSSSAFKSIDWVKSNIQTQKGTLIDARSSGRFIGTEPEPREGLRSGSIPNSCNLPYAEVLENGFFKSKEKLQEIFASLEDNEKPFVFSCGSGVTACILLLAANIAGYQNLSVYDGSWTEWASLVE